MTEEDRDRYFRQGVRRLREWMPSCRAVALTSGDIGMQDASAVAGALLPHIREKNLEALIISPGEKGGWHADLFMRGLPPGVANTMGSPVQSPFKTREEAEEYGKRLLELTLWKCHQNEKMPASNPTESGVVFELYGWNVRIPGVVLTTIREQMPDHRDEPFGSMEKATARLRQALEQLVPDGAYKTFDFGGVPRDKMLPLIVVLVGCSLHGMFRYPPYQPMAPGEGPPARQREDAAP